VMKRVTLFLSVATVGVGIWLLIQGHSQVSSCNGFAGQIRATSAGTFCARATSSYLIGAALTMGGLVIATLVLFAMAKHASDRDWNKRLPTLPQKRQHVVETVAR
jgi:hypothetical protein